MYAVCANVVDIVRCPSCRAAAQLEHNMKLWWPHAEAMIAFAMGLAVTHEPRYWARFQEVAAWTYGHFVDKRHGEWYGYLNRHGAVSQTFKGGPYKGCFHVPRAVWLCISELEKAAATLE